MRMLLVTDTGSWAGTWYVNFNGASAGIVYSMYQCAVLYHQLQLFSYGPPIVSSTRLARQEMSTDRVAPLNNIPIVSLRSPVVLRDAGNRDRCLLVRDWSLLL